MAVYKDKYVAYELSKKIGFKRNKDDQRPWTAVCKLQCLSKQGQSTSKGIVTAFSPVRSDDLTVIVKLKWLN